MEFVGKIVSFFTSEWVTEFILFIVLALDFWLGKTNLVKPGSTAEAILSPAASLLKKIVGFLKKDK